MPDGVKLGVINVSIFSVGADPLQLSQGVNSRWGIGGNRSVSVALPAIHNWLSIPYAAWD
jgi:hypothetical protein